MRHRLQRKVFDGKKSPQKSRASSTFTTNSDGNPHSAKKNKLHSKSTYFYNDDSSSGQPKPAARIFHKASFLGCAGCNLRERELCNTRHTRNEQRRTGCRWNDRAVRRLSKLTYIVPSVCALALLIGGIITLSPILNNVEKVNAEDGIMATSDTPPTISINLAAGDASASRRTPAKAGEVTYRTDIFTIGGTGMSKYIVSLNTPSGKTGELIGKNNPYATVGKVADNTATGDFAENTWGYAITNDTTTADIEKTLHYNPVPSGMDSSKNSVEVASRAGIDKTTAVADSYKIAFAANFGKDLPADDYMADVYLSVVASPEYSLSITTMQGMTSTICSSIPDEAINKQFQLEDTREPGKKYWVAKLKDGNCWMTQNFDFDIPTTLSEETSDVTGTNVATGISSSTAISNWTNTDNTANVYHDPENIFYTYTGHGQVPSNTCHNVTSFGVDDCKSYFTKIDSPTAENMHYHVGNYYTWDAATVRSRSGAKAASSSYNVAENAPMSICPKGWQLPTGNNTNDKSFGALMQAYSITGSDLTTSDGSLFDKPLYFVYGGYLSSDKLHNAGDNGGYWSSTPYSAVYTAYGLFFANSVNPSGDGARYLGYSVRCVAK